MLKNMCSMISCLNSSGELAGSPPHVSDIIKTYYYKQIRIIHENLSAARRVSDV